MLKSMLVIIPRTLLGLMFLFAGLDGFAYLARGRELFKPPLSEEGRAFLHSLKLSRPLWALKSTVDIAAAGMLLANIHAPLAFLLLLPSIAVIILFQISINHVGTPMAMVLSILTLVMAVHYMSLYRPLLLIADGDGPLSSELYGHLLGVEGNANP
jgi:hypothetical protein